MYSAIIGRRHDASPSTSTASNTSTMPVAERWVASRLSVRSRSTGYDNAQVVVDADELLSTAPPRARISSGPLDAGAER